MRYDPSRSRQGFKRLHPAVAGLEQLIAEVGSGHRRLLASDAANHSNFNWFNFYI